MSKTTSEYQRQLDNGIFLVETGERQSQIPTDLVVQEDEGPVIPPLVGKACL